MNSYSKSSKANEEACRKQNLICAVRFARLGREAQDPHFSYQIPLS